MEGTKFLVKNIASQPGLYRVGNDDFILNPGEQKLLDYPPVFKTVEIKVIQMKN